MALFDPNADPIYRLTFPGPREWPATTDPARPQTVDAWREWQYTVGREIEGAKFVQRILYVWGARAAPFITLFGGGTAFATIEGMNQGNLCAAVSFIAAASVYAWVERHVVPLTTNHINRAEARASNAAKIQADAYRTAGFPGRTP